MTSECGVDVAAWQQARALRACPVPLGTAALETIMTAHQLSEADQRSMVADLKPETYARLSPLIDTILAPTIEQPDNLPRITDTDRVVMTLVEEAIRPEHLNLRAL